MKRKVLRVWRLLLSVIFVFILVHLLKDITQDILRIKTPLDIFGDAKEDLSFLSPTFQNIYLYGLGGISFVAEAFILYAIPKVLKSKTDKIPKLEKWLIASVVFLIIFFTTATLLDPRF